MDAPIRWQFSLRALLLIVPLCGVLLVAWRVLGGSVFLSVAAFVLASAAPPWLLKWPWNRAYLLAYFAVCGSLKANVREAPPFTSGI